MKGKLRPIIRKEEIAKAIQKAAQDIETEYREKNLVILMVLKGAVCLVADLMRELSIPFCLESVQCSSYGQRGTQRGELQVLGLDTLNFTGKDVLIVDDIYDSGKTLGQLIRLVEAKNCLSVKTCVLLEKNVPRTGAYTPDFSLFEIENLFVVGYGLDYKELYRGLTDVCVLEEEL